MVVSALPFGGKVDIKRAVILVQLYFDIALY